MGSVPGPVVILVEPQLAANIGMAARAMANFALSELRLVAPRDGWPQPGAAEAAANAAPLLAEALVFDTTRAAVADLHFVLATTARERGQMKRVLAPEPALAEAGRRIAAGERVGILFGRERTGLENDEVSLADAIVTFPVQPGFGSVNLAQSVLLIAYEWSRVMAAPPPFVGETAPPALRQSLISLFDYLEAELDAAGFYPADKKPIMTRNMRDILHRMELTEQDVRTLRGAFRALAEGRRARKP